MHLISLPLAQLTRSVEQPMYELSRLEMLADRPALSALVIVAGIAIISLVVGLYWREARTVGVPRAMLLGLLRCVALAGLATFFLGIERRINREVTEPSRVVVLADTSLSMNLAATDVTRGPLRSDLLRGLLVDSPLVSELAQLHEVEIVAFDDLPRPLSRSNATAANSAGDGTNTADEVASAGMNLNELLTPSGKSTQVGSALATTLKQYQTLPLAGVVVISDGGQNTGPDPVPLAHAVRDAGAVLHAVGIGPLEAPANVAVRELLAPQRAFPGDDITITALVQVQSATGQSIDVTLIRRPADQPDAAGELADTQSINAVSDGELATLRFETRVDDAGKYLFEVLAAPLPTETDASDNARQALVEIIERQTRVLLLAGAASRDYRFLSNQLRRDKSFTVDVLLQTGSEGVSQDANKVLTEFPDTAEKLVEYDAIVAFDPAWTAIPADRLQLLDRWVAKQAGGLVLVPSPVNTATIGVDSLPKVVQDLYPVHVADQWQAAVDPTASRAEPQRIEFSRAGLEAEYLWLAESAAESFDAWGKFGGVYGALAVGDTKPGATVYATAIDEATTGLAGMPYLAGQYYGAGQVFFIGSSETWRLRSVDTDYFDQLWTKLLRHVSQGRLLNDSQRGKLLVGQDRYQVGDTIDLRAVLADAQLNPLDLPQVQLELTLPTGESVRLPLKHEESGQGNYSATYRATQAGDYRLELPIPDSEERLTRTVQVALPQLEVGQVIQNAALLEQLSSAGGGEYYASPSLALSGDGDRSALTKSIPSRERARVVPGAVDMQFAQRLSGGLLGVIVVALASEWVIRRFSYLA